MKRVEVTLLYDTKMSGRRMGIDSRSATRCWNGANDIPLASSNQYRCYRPTRTQLELRPFLRLVSAPISIVF